MGAFALAEVTIKGAVCEMMQNGTPPALSRCDDE